MMDVKRLATANIQKSAIHLQKEEIQNIVRDNVLNKIKMEVDLQSTAKQLRQMGPLIAG